MQLACLVRVVLAIPWWRWTGRVKLLISQSCKSTPTFSLVKPTQNFIKEKTIKVDTTWAIKAQKHEGIITSNQTETSCNPWTKQPTIRQKFPSHSSCHETSPKSSVLAHVVHHMGGSNINERKVEVKGGQDREHGSHLFLVLTPLHSYHMWCGANQFLLKSFAKCKLILPRPCSLIDECDMDTINGGSKKNFLEPPSVHVNQHSSINE